MNAFTDIQASKPATPKRARWGYDAMRIAIMYVLEHEGDKTRAELCQRLDHSGDGQFGAALRTLESSGHISKAGYPSVYSFESHFSVKSPQ